MMMGLYMKRIYRYSGIMALSVSLIMLSLGSILQSYAGSVTSTIVVDITCGMTLVGDADFGTSILIGAALTNANIVSVPTIENTGVATTPIAVAVGTITGGGYADTGTITHIAPADIDMKIAGSTFNGGAFQTLDDTGADTNLGPLGPVSGATALEFQVEVTGINPPITDPNWSATYTFTAGTCFV